MSFWVPSLYCSTNDWSASCAKLDIVMMLVYFRNEGQSQSSRFIYNMNRVCNVKGSAKRGVMRMLRSRRGHLAGSTCGSCCAGSLVLSHVCLRMMWASCSVAGVMTCRCCLTRDELLTASHSLVMAVESRHVKHAGNFTMMLGLYMPASRGSLALQGWTEQKTVSRV